MESVKIAQIIKERNKMGCIIVLKNNKFERIFETMRS